MSLKHASTTELLKEINKRIDQKKITWGTTYYFDKDKREFYLKSEPEKFCLSFTQEARTEHNLFVHQVYQRFEPTLLKIQEQRNTAEQKEKEKQIEETLRAWLEKKQ